MHIAFRYGFKKTASSIKLAQTPEEDAYARGVIAGYQQAMKQTEIPQEQAAPQGQTAPQEQAATPEGSPTGATQMSYQASYNPATVAGQTGMPDAIQSNALNQSPPPERRNMDLSPQAAKPSPERPATPSRKVVPPIPQRNQRDYGEQFAGAQSPYSSMY